MIWKRLDDYQQKGVLFVENKEGSALYFEQGTGKTWVTAGIIERAINRIDDFTALGFVPLTNKESTWVKTLQPIVGLNVCLSLDELASVEPPRILLLHPHVIFKRGPIYNKLLNKIVNLHWDFVWIDEAQGLNSRSSQMSRASRRLRDQPWRCILTGTPFDAAPEQTWAQMRFVDYKMFGKTELGYTKRGTRITEYRPVWIGEVYAAFEKEFLEPCGFRGFKRRFREGKRELYETLVAPYIMRVEADEVLNVPKPVYVNVRYHMIGKQRQIYDQMEADQIADIRPYEQAVAELKITQQIRLQQITGGWLAVDGQPIEKIGDARQRALRKLFRTSLKPPIVIFCRYTHEINEVVDISKNFHERVEKLDGSVGKGKTKSTTRAKLNADFLCGMIDVLVVQTKTGGVGIDLFSSWQCVAYSFGHSYIDFDQMIKRLVRRGQTKRVHIYLLEAISSIDSDLITAVQIKRHVSEVFFERISKTRKKLWQTKSQ